MSDWSSDVCSSDLSRSRADVVRALRHIEPATSFRSGYAYDNILYVVAGELVAAVSGQSWESFIRDRVFRAAGMDDSVSDETERFRSEEHTSELQSLMRISYAVFCLTKKTLQKTP